MVRVILGVLKGAIVGGGLGVALLKLGWTSGVFAYLACAVVGAIVGVVAGRAPWQSETIWTPVVKMIAGAIVGAGLCFVGLRFLPDLSFHVKELGDDPLALRSAPLLAPIIGVIYGVFVELDDGGAKKDQEPAEAKRAPARKPK